jgi:geranylgeranyl diphosphate synthase type II
MSFEDKIQKYRLIFEISLRDFLNREADKKQIPPKLYEAMSYSLKTEGKRVLSALCMAGSELSGIHEISEKVLPMALAIEFFHTSMLIHCDMPCMSNNELRLGKSACHVVHGEALALLSGSAIPLWGMKHAIEGLIKNQIPLENIINAFIIFLESAGAAGALGGQSLDIDSDKAKDMEDIILTTSMRTGDLIKASVKAGAVLAGISGEDLKNIDTYGYYMGTCFQIIDDILDESASIKEREQEQKQEKNSFVSLLGIEEARSLAENCADKAIIALNSSYPGEVGEFLRDFTKNLLEKGNSVTRI